jgi:hypothetical protein
MLSGVPNISICSSVLQKSSDWNPIHAERESERE